MSYTFSQQKGPDDISLPVMGEWRMAIRTSMCWCYCILQKKVFKSITLCSQEESVIDGVIPSEALAWFGTLMISCLSFFFFFLNSYFAALWSLNMDLPRAKDSCRLLFWPQGWGEQTGICLLILLHLSLAEKNDSNPHFLVKNIICKPTCGSWFWAPVQNEVIHCSDPRKSHQSFIDR